MTIQKGLILVFLFITFHLVSQETKPKNLLTNNASIGLTIGTASYISTASDFKTNFCINYTKHVNSIIALQGGFTSERLPNSKDGNSFNGLTANGIINLSNLSYSSNSKSILYISAGGKLLNTKKGKELIPNLGGGLKYAINDNHQNIDLDLSATLGIAPNSNDARSYMMFGLGLNYRFTRKDKSIEWHNPLNAMYQNITDLKSKVDSISTNHNHPNKANPTSDELTNLKTEITNIHANNIKNVYTIIKNNLIEIERLNKEIAALKTKNNLDSVLNESVTEKETNNNYHLIAGCFASRTNAENMISKLQSEGFKPSIIGQDAKGLFRVAFDSYLNKDDALLQMENLKASKKSTWLLQL